MFNKLRTVIYRVGDLAVAKKWYALITGIQPYFDEPFYVGFDINGHELGLDPNAPDTGPGNHTVSYWAVDDVATAVVKITGAGGKLIQPKTNVGGTINIAIIEDPFGNQFGVIEGA
jgi:predicted enzyme related to lactoylglutathione lyase